jgi:hypothetical protein
MADQLYFSRDKQKFGPFTERQLKDLAAKGQVLGTDIVWKEGMKIGWPAAKIKNLFPAAPTEAATGTPETVNPSPDGSAAAPGSAPRTEEASEQPAQSSDALADADEESPDETQPDGPKSNPRAPPAKKGRAIGAKGAIIMSQDGTVVSFRKKCLKCGYEDPSKSRLPIRSGVTRTSFFCRKCRKSGPVEIQCVM